jgi:ParB family chromosome partitioning protein
LALDRAHHITCARAIPEKTLSVREAERMVAREASGGGRQAPLLRVRREKSRDVARLEEELSDALTAPVEIRIKKRSKRGEQGELAIAFASLDELNGLIERMRTLR